MRNQIAIMIYIYIQWVGLPCMHPCTSFFTMNVLFCYYVRHQKPFDFIVFIVYFIYVQLWINWFEFILNWVTFRGISQSMSGKPIPPDLRKLWGNHPETFVWESPSFCQLQWMLHNYRKECSRKCSQTHTSASLQCCQGVKMLT